MERQKHIQIAKVLASQKPSEFSKPDYQIWCELVDSFINELKNEFMFDKAVFEKIAGR